MEYVWMGLAYIGIGVLYSLAYIFAYKPEDKGESTTTWLGLLIILWPVIIVLELVLQLVGAMGSVVRIIQDRLAKKAGMVQK